MAMPAPQKPSSPKEPQPPAPQRAGPSLATGQPVTGAANKPPLDRCQWSQPQCSGALPHQASAPGHIPPSPTALQPVRSGQTCSQRAARSSPEEKPPQTEGQSGATLLKAEPAPPKCCKHSRHSVPSPSVGTANQLSLLQHSAKGAGAGKRRVKEVKRVVEACS